MKVYCCSNGIKQKLSIVAKNQPKTKYEFLDFKKVISLPNAYNIRRVNYRETPPSRYLIIIVYYVFLCLPSVYYVTSYAMKYMNKNCDIISLGFNDPKIYLRINNMHLFFLKGRGGGQRQVFRCILSIKSK